jgi:putative transposase
MTFLSRVIFRSAEDGDGRTRRRTCCARWCSSWFRRRSRPSSTSFIGGQSLQATDARRGWRNGFKPRTFKTRVGKLVLRIPQDRQGQFQPSFFERYERIEKALITAMTEMYVHGVSTRKVSKIVEQLCGHLISASAVSAVTRKLDDEVTPWWRRSLAGKRYPYLVIDAHCEQLRREGSVRSTAVLWVVGIGEDGYREHLGLWTGSAESPETWGAVFRDLVDRGVAGVEMTVSDEHLGLVQALKRYFPYAAHQRCTVHYLRNALTHVSSTRWKQELRDSLRDVWAAPDRAEAKDHSDRLINRCRKPVPQLAQGLEQTIEETLTFLDHSAPEHRRLLKTTNGMEHDHAEVRRRSRVVRVVANEASLVRVLGACRRTPHIPSLGTRSFAHPPLTKGSSMAVSASDLDAETGRETDEGADHGGRWHDRARCLHPADGRAARSSRERASIPASAAAGGSG